MTTPGQQDLLTTNLAKKALEGAELAEEVSTPMDLDTASISRVTPALQSLSSSFSRENAEIRWYAMKADIQMEIERILLSLKTVTLRMGTFLKSNI